MRGLIAEFRCQALAALEHRVAALAGVATQTFFGVVRMSILSAAYASGRPGPLPLAAVVDYVWLSQALMSLVPFRIEGDLAEAVRGGAIATDLLRPGDPWSRWYARLLARRAVATALRAGPLLTLSLALGWLQPPASPIAAGMAVLAILLAVLLGAALALTAGLTVLWTISGQGMSVLMPLCAWTCSGMILPLPLFPDAMQPVLAAMPFRGLIDTPARLWSGAATADVAAAALAHQVAWIVVLVVCGRSLFTAGLRRLTILGG